MVLFFIFLLENQTIICIIQIIVVILRREVEEGFRGWG